jgi:hypothetical protein
MSIQPKSPPRLDPPTLHRDTSDLASHAIPAEEHPIFQFGASSADIQRVIVLIPNTNIDSGKLQSEVIRLGLNHYQGIVLLGSGDTGDGSRASKLYRLAIQLGIGGTQVSCQNIRPGETWTAAVQRASQPGDLIACHAEYQGHKLGQKISAELGLAVCVLSGLYPTLPRRLLQLVGRACFEVTPLLIILGTFWFQIRISEETTGIVNTIALIMTIIFELGLLFLWSLFIS